MNDAEISIRSGLEIYSDKLVNEGIVTQDDVKSVREKYEKICEEAFELAKKETHIKVIRFYNMHSRMLKMLMIFFHFLNV